MKKYLFSFILIAIWGGLQGQTPRMNPVIGFSGGMGISMIENYEFKNPFSKSQLAFSLTGRIKLKLNKNSPYLKSWIYYSNTLMWIDHSGSQISGWVTPNIPQNRSNLITQHKLGFIVKKWLLLEAGTYNELGGKNYGYSAGGGFNIPIKNHSIELKGTYMFEPNSKNYLFYPSIQFNIDPKQ